MIEKDYTKDYIVLMDGFHVDIYEEEFLKRVIKEVGKEKPKLNTNEN